MSGESQSELDSVGRKTCIPSHPLTSLLHAIICIYTFDKLSRSQDLVVGLVRTTELLSESKRNDPKRGRLFRK